MIGDRQREADGEEAGRAVHEVVEASLRWETQLFVDACRGDDLQNGEDDGGGGRPDLHGDDTGEEELEVGRLLDGLDRLAGKGASAPATSASKTSGMSNQNTLGLRCGVEPLGIDTAIGTLPGGTSPPLLDAIAFS